MASSIARWATARPRTAERHRRGTKARPSKRRRFALRATRRRQSRERFRRKRGWKSSKSFARSSIRTVERPVSATPWQLASAALARPAPRRREACFGGASPGSPWRRPARTASGIALARIPASRCLRIGDSNLFHVSCRQNVEKVRIRALRGRATEQRTASPRPTDGAPGAHGPQARAPRANAPMAFARRRYGCPRPRSASDRADGPRAANRRETVAERARSREARAEGEKGAVRSAHEGCAGEPWGSTMPSRALDARGGGRAGRRLAKDRIGCGYVRFRREPASSSRCAALQRKRPEGESAQRGCRLSRAARNSRFGRPSSPARASGRMPGLSCSRARPCSRVARERAAARRLDGELRKHDLEARPAFGAVRRAQRSALRRNDRLR